LSTFCHSILRTPGLGGAVSPGVRKDASRHPKGGPEDDGVLATALLVALLVIDRLVGR